MDSINEPKEESSKKYQIHGQGDVLRGFVFPCPKNLGHESQGSTSSGYKTDNLNDWHKLHI